MRKRRKNRAVRSAFTLLELMLVLAILVVLAGVVGYNILGTQDTAFTQTTETQLQGLRNNIVMYRLRVNQMPDSLDALVDGPSDSDKKATWQPIITEVPKDAWGNDITLSVNGNKFELRSAGADGQMNSDDDVVVEG